MYQSIPIVPLKNSLSFHESETARYETEVLKIDLDFYDKLSPPEFELKEGEDNIPSYIDYFFEENKLFFKIVEDFNIDKNLKVELVIKENNSELVSTTYEIWLL